VDIAIEFFIIPAVLGFQGLLAWINNRRAQSTQNLAAITNLNETVDMNQARIAVLETEALQRTAELATLRPLAAQVPILKAQVEALEKHLTDSLERERKLNERINRPCPEIPVQS